MKHLAVLIGALGMVSVSALAARGDDVAVVATQQTQALERGRRAFEQVAQVLLSPRCRNCHPAADRPLQTDAGRAHRMNISRASAEAGLPCSTCHQEQNSEVLGVEGGPPGAPHWGLPAVAPMTFEGRSVSDLCRQLIDVNQTGGRNLEALLHHVSEDPLVLWAWQPGGTRTTPDLSHAEFVVAFRVWVEAGGVCP